MQKLGGSNDLQNNAGNEGGAAAAEDERLTKLEQSVNKLILGMNQLGERVNSGLVDPKVMEKILQSKKAEPSKTEDPLAGIDFENADLKDIVGAIMKAVDSKLNTIPDLMEERISEAIKPIKQDTVKASIRDFKRTYKDKLDDETMNAVVEVMQENPGLTLENAFKLVDHGRLTKAEQERQTRLDEAKKLAEAKSDTANFAQLPKDKLEQVKEGKLDFHSVLTEKAGELLTSSDLTE